MSDSDRLPSGFRKLTPRERSDAFFELARATPLERIIVAPNDTLLELADAMVESSVGAIPIPLGIAAGFLIDGRVVDVPMATEEPSVIAAATYAARIVRSGGGFTTWADPPIVTSQIFLADCGPVGAARLQAQTDRIQAAADASLERMRARGGGVRELDVCWLPESGLVRLQIHIDVRDAMGANTADTVAESIRPLAQEISGGSVLMAILTNDGSRRRAGARFELPVAKLARGRFSGDEAAARIAHASLLAGEDPSRAVTHNKGIMNGVTAIAIATGNDTRGLEAAVHAYAARDGRYRSLSEFSVRNAKLHGTIELPVPLGTVGGAAGIHPASAAALKALGSPGSTSLGRIAAAVGLAQNLAALFALATEGIQRGHMSLHERRLAWRSRMESGR